MSEFKLKSHLELLDEVEVAFLDILDGNQSWTEIRAATGLPEKRCKEIESLFSEVEYRYKSRHGIGDQ